ncbi:3-oxoacyl-[acyl-carrier-protein] synthase [Tulasnella sp. 427]|nr:3-oxoacyl-[acyl-carrier-protein] synthase [Tulasnella sp. 427]
MTKDPPLSSSASKSRASIRRFQHNSAPSQTQSRHHLGVQFQAHRCLSQQSERNRCIWNYVRGKIYLVADCGKGSTGVEVLKGFLSGGARITVMTSRYSQQTAEYCRDVFHRTGSRDSALTVVPFNQDSTLNLDLDYVIIRFAALGTDDRSQLDQCIMLTNVEPVVSPSSANHGLFGNGDAYSDSKISLKTIFNRWNSESCGGRLARSSDGLGELVLMSGTAVVAHQLESHRTPSAREMAFNRILGLMQPLLFSITQVEPIWAKWTCFWTSQVVTKIRLEPLKQNDSLRAATDAKVSAEAKLIACFVCVHLAMCQLEFPALETIHRLSDLTKLHA